LRRIVLHWLRRAHLYAGLLMLPWVILYGITAFLFNHPTFFSDRPIVTFGGQDLQGTPLRSMPKPDEVAEQVVAELQKRAPEGMRYELVERDRVKYNRDFAFATVRENDQEINILFEVNGSGGTIRSRPALTPKEMKLAPFAIGSAREGAAPKKSLSPQTPRSDALMLPEPLHERVKATVPIVLEKHGFPVGEATVTSVPDLVFLMDANGERWRVTYNAQQGTVAGQPADEEEPKTISTRAFLLRLHLTHGYPGETGVRSFWAIAVDATAIVMLFWSLSGLFMWWQIKATRRWGSLVLLVSVAAATWIGFAMHDMLTVG
jgi:hypothetical protein